MGWYGQNALGKHMACSDFVEGWFEGADERVFEWLVMPKVTSQCQDYMPTALANG